MERTRPTTRLLASACAAALLALSLAATVIADDQATYAQIVETLRKELATPFTDPDDPGLLARRARLRTLFGSVPPAYAKTLFDRLGAKPTGDDLSKEFHYRLARATRQELLGILAAIPPPAPPAAPAPRPTPVLVWGTMPLPRSEAPRFDAALDRLEDLVARSNDPRKWRYQCWFNKLKAGADDRVIEWGRICPAKYGAIGAAYIVGPCDLTWGTPVSQDVIHKNIRTVADVEARGADIDIITHLRSDFVVAVEMTALPFENLQTTHDMVVMAIDKLDKWANNPMGGSSAMAKEYVSIKDWIGQQQRDPNSVYSCK